MNNLLQVIEDDLKAAWGEIEHTAEGIVNVVEQDAITIWADFRGIVTAALPTEYSTLKKYILVALTDVVNGDLADVETAVLNAVQESEAWIKEIGSTTMQAIIAVVKVTADKAAK